MYTSSTRRYFVSLTLLPLSLFHSDLTAPALLSTADPATANMISARPASASNGGWCCRRRWLSRRRQAVNKLNEKDRAEGSGQGAVRSPPDVGCAPMRPASRRDRAALRHSGSRQHTRGRRAKGS